jgi:hypothetical protein
MYINSVLSTFLVNVSLNIVFDNFVVRPLASVVLGIALSFNEGVYGYVVEC